MERVVNLNGRSRGLTSPIPLITDGNCEFKRTREAAAKESINKLHQEYDLKENAHLNLSELFKIPVPFDSQKVALIKQMNSQKELQDKFEVLLKDRDFGMTEEIRELQFKTSNEKPKVVHQNQIKIPAKLRNTVGNLIGNEPPKEIPHITSAHYYEQRRLLVICFINSQVKFWVVKGFQKHHLDIRKLNETYYCPFFI